MPTALSLAFDSEGLPKQEQGIELAAGARRSRLHCDADLLAGSLGPEGDLAAASGPVGKMTKCVHFGAATEIYPHLDFLVMQK
jgi:hypothetical protein